MECACTCVELWTKDRGRSSLAGWAARSQLYYITHYSRMISRENTPNVLTREIDTHTHKKVTRMRCVYCKQLSTRGDENVHPLSCSRQSACDNKRLLVVVKAAFLGIRECCTQLLMQVHLRCVCRQPPENTPLSISIHLLYVACVLHFRSVATYIYVDYM